jgi:uncharacterized protein YjbI with pentapeptide repeats
MIRSGTQYSEKVFEGVILERALVETAGFNGCTFSGCSFVETTLDRCRFVNCVFKRCDLNLARVPSCSFDGNRFEHSKLMGVNWTKAHWPTTRLRPPFGFFACTVSHSTFIGLELREVQIQDCAAADVDFREADLSQADLSGTDFSESIFLQTDLTEADFTGAYNYQIDPTRNTVRKAKFDLPEAMSLLYALDILLEEPRPDRFPDLGPPSPG